MTGSIILWAWSRSLWQAVTPSYMLRLIIVSAVSLSATISRVFVADLEVFGFAVSEALHDAKSENVGLRDQKVALQCELAYLWGGTLPDS